LVASAVLRTAGEEERCGTVSRSSTPTPTSSTPPTAEPDTVELAQRLRVMDEGGVRQALVIPGHGYLRPSGLADTRRVNNEIAAYRDRTPDRFPVACGIVEPRDGPQGLAEIDRIAFELGLVAISFHTRFQGVSVDSQWVLRYLERMGEVGLLPVVHAMDDTPEESLWKLASIARAFPT
jgi:predicted TIM-barrel fold metal-dependent hydrolase